MQYRREIDGLRSVAVVPVILFHSGLTLFSGGFVGVDIFFVISGYLITSILIGELDGGNFSIAKFYERRARRILPALFVVLLVSIPLVWLVALPPQFASFAKSIVWVCMFVSNMFFWLNSGYFSSTAELQPLLHTWSLAVEEQYYVFFPVALGLVWRFGRKKVVILIAVSALASLALSEWGWRHSPDANFYFAPTRAWELFAGSLCAFAGDRSSSRDNLSGLAGLGLIVFAIFRYDGSIPFPSVYALVPVIGTVLVILRGGAGTWTGKILSHKVFVGIGLISYSAYLWHQPLFSVARLGSFEEPPRALMMALVALTFLLAYLSWRFVEAPFRRRGGVFKTRPRLFAACAAVGAAIAVPSYVASKTPGITAAELQHPDLFREKVIAVVPPQECEGFAQVRSGDAACRKYGNGPRTIVIWGDSHAEVLAKSIRPIEGATIYLISHLGCPPAAGLSRADGKGNCRTPADLDKYFEYVRARHPETVVLMARWTLYMQGWHRLDRPQPITYFVTRDQANLPGGAAGSSSALARSLDQTVRSLRAASKVVIVSQPPDLQALSDRALVFTSAVPASSIAPWHAGETALLEGIAARNDTLFLDARSVFCDTQVCHLRDRDGYRNYFDDNHLSPVGLEQLWSRIVPLLAARPAAGD